MKQNLRHKKTFLKNFLTSGRQKESKDDKRTLLWGSSWSFELFLNP